MKKTALLLLLLTSFLGVKAQTIGNMPYDSIKVGRSTGLSGTNLWGRVYLPHTPVGSGSTDSILTILNKRVRKVATLPISKVAGLQDSLTAKAVKDNFIHLKDYGADTTGASNSYTSFVNAIAAAKAKGTSLYIDNGTYRIDSSISIAGFHKAIFSNGATITTTGDFAIFSVENSERIVISGLNFSGTKASLSQTGITIATSNRSIIEKCTFDNLGYGIHVVSTSSPSGQVNNGLVRINNCLVKRSTQGVYVAAIAEYVQISNSVFTTNDEIGAHLVGGNFSFVNNQCVYNSWGVLVDGSSGTGVDHGRIVGNVMNHNYQVNLYIKDLKFSLTVVGNDIWAVDLIDLPPYTRSFGVFIKNSEAVTLTGNTIARNEVSIGLDNSDRNIITGNTLIGGDLGVTVRHIWEFGDSTSTKNILSVNNYVNENNAAIDAITLLPGSTYGGTAIYKDYSGESISISGLGSFGSGAFGNSKIGNSSGFGGNYIRFGHKNFDGTSNYGFMQDNAGNVYIGGPAEFSHTPLAPTATAGDNSTKLATTAYVDAAVSSATSLVSTWTPTVTGGFTSATDGTYTKTGRQIHAYFSVTVSTNSDTNTFEITGLPFTPSDNYGVVTLRYNNTGAVIYGRVTSAGTGTIQFTDTSGTAKDNTYFSGKVLQAVAEYITN